MDFTTLIGYVASSLTTISFVPQVYKTWKTKSAKDISFMMFLMLVTGVFLWIIYGFIRQDFPLLIGNSITFVLSAIILFYKVKEMRNGDKD